MIGEVMLISVACVACGTAETRTPVAQSIAPSPTREGCDSVVPWPHTLWGDIPSETTTLLLETFDSASSLIDGVRIIVTNRSYIVAADVEGRQHRGMRVFWLVRDSGAQTPQRDDIEMISDNSSDGTLQEAIEYAQLCLDKLASLR